MSFSTALVLAGGGSLGAVQVGMLQALIEAGVRFDMVVGSSVGAINGAYFATQPNSAGVAALGKIWSGLRKPDVFPFSLSDSLAGLLRNRSHLLQPVALTRLIRRALTIRRIEEAVLPLHIVTTDLLSGAEVILSSGDAEQALLASTAIPLVFPAVRWNERILVDGSVCSNTPIAGAVALGATCIVVLPTGFACACDEAPKGLIALALHTLNLMSMRQLARDADLFAAHASIHVVAPLCPLSISVFDFGRTDELLQRARAQTLAWLEAGGLDQPGLPESLQAHHHAGFDMQPQPMLARS
ncbi:NTE family protein RssA [Pseudomonas sp. SCT]|uniref:patatin-like phospholipase family protein n=1 Tax=Pseudomonas sp. (strain SCT) TaxID=412955 RepID=UPI000EECCC86|nr:patatin-like phospholipase family protein [Pseudomonas sp. SCT]GCA58255.1 NTE family protein RssA [Pseudomonas sp. SCT]